MSTGKWVDRELIFKLKNKGLTGAQIAERLGITRNTVYKVLKGDAKK